MSLGLSVAWVALIKMALADSDLHYLEVLSILACRSNITWQIFTLVLELSNGADSLNSQSHNVQHPSALLHGLSSAFQDYCLSILKASDHIGELAPHP